MNNKNNNTSERSGVLTGLGSLGAAVLASACCWLPLLLLTLGVSAAGVGGFFERTRPYFLIVAAILLAAGFYSTYFRKAACKPGEACAVPNRRIGRFNQVMLWIAAVLVVAVALFPKWGASLLEASSARPAAIAASAGSPAALDAASEPPIVTLRIEGMTCEVCAVGLRRQLEETNGVTSAVVRYNDATAAVTLETHEPATLERLITAVEHAGYGATIAR